MGEETKQEQARNETKPEEKKEENPPPPPPPPPPEEEKPTGEAENKGEEPAQGPRPFILYVELHCAGCAKKIERSLMRIPGVEGVEIDMGENQVHIKGVVDAEAVCNMMTKKTNRNVKVLSPLPTRSTNNQGEPLPDLISSQVTNTVELNVNMHCEACAGQLKKIILKMTGVQTVETELSSGKVKVTGSMDENKLVDYVYRRTKKQARIVPQPQPETPKPEEPKPEAVTEPEKEPKPEEITQEQQSGEKPPEEPRNDKEGGENIQGTLNKDGGDGGMVINTINIEEESSMKRMMMSNYNYTPNYYNYYQPKPIYFIDTTPPPQLFSDENPNACCIT